MQTVSTYARVIFTRVKTTQVNVTAFHGFRLK